MTRRLEIRVRGTLPADAAEQLGLRASVRPAETVLRGRLADRPALHGVLDRLGANGIEVVEVRRLPDRSREAIMSLGASLFLIARRRDPALRGHGRLAGIDIQTVGTILMVIGVLGFAISLWLFLSARRRGEAPGPPH